MEELDEMIQQFSKDYNDILQHAFEEKLKDLYEWARNNDPALFVMISGMGDVSVNKLDMLMTSLEKYGYKLTIHMDKSPYPYKFENTGSSFKAVIEMDKIRIKVTKTIFDK